MGREGGIRDKERRRRVFVRGGGRTFDPFHKELQVFLHLALVRVLFVAVVCVGGGKC